MELRVLSTLLNEMDGVEAADGTRTQYISGCVSSIRILQIHTKHAALAKDVDLMWLAHEADMFSGAELEVYRCRSHVVLTNPTHHLHGQNVCREAALLALRDNIMATEIEMTHFQQALRSASPVSTNASLQVYKAFSSRQGPN
ncbi:hypothetical protein DYB32_008760 [Aphanomyces invadans]|uniref:Uncharacterized protein n=1 Tax=Aphanomyces invadans TaxID=157072 RepID=A0A418ASK5_9STRA|nr:hypothetical protein DYB32_008760 [Aphanomyces invadans]